MAFNQINQAINEQIDVGNRFNQNAAYSVSAVSSSASIPGNTITITSVSSPTSMEVIVNKGGVITSYNTDAQGIVTAQNVHNSAASNNLNNKFNPNENPGYSSSIAASSVSSYGTNGQGVSGVTNINSGATNLNSAANNEAVLITNSNPGFINAASNQEYLNGNAQLGAVNANSHANLNGHHHDNAHIGVDSNSYASSLENQQNPGYNGYGIYAYASPQSSEDNTHLGAASTNINQHNPTLNDNIHLGGVNSNSYAAGNPVGFGNSFDSHDVVGQNRPGPSYSESSSSSSSSSTSSSSANSGTKSSSTSTSSSSSSSSNSNVGGSHSPVSSKFTASSVSTNTELDSPIDIRFSNKAPANFQSSSVSSSSSNVNGVQQSSISSITNKNGEISGYSVEVDPLNVVKVSGNEKGSVVHNVDKNEHGETHTFVSKFQNGEGVIQTYNKKP